MERGLSLPRSPSKQVIPEDTITILKSLGSGEFGTVSQGVWTNDDDERVCWFFLKIVVNKLISFI